VHRAYFFKLKIWAFKKTKKKKKKKKKKMEEWPIAPSRWKRYWVICGVLPYGTA
jgi:hypothetical protein